MLVRSLLSIAAVLVAIDVYASPPVASYIFPAGGQRGKTVPVRVGGLFLHEECPFVIVGPGVTASPTLKRTPTLWFEGPILPLPESQQAEDYPQDMAGQIVIAPDAPLGPRYGRLWTSQGAASHLKFVVGELPEIVEEEIEGDPIPVAVKAPVTINGRIFPREDVDIWTVTAKKGETFSCIVHAARLGAPLDARLEIYDAKNRLLAENDDAFGADPALRFTAPDDGVYQIRIRDAQLQGGQAYVYRLSIVTGPIVDRVFPLGGRQGEKLTLDLAGHGLNSPKHDLAIPADAAKAGFLMLDLPGREIQPLSLDIDDLPEAVEGRSGPKDPLPTPVVLNGRIAHPGEVDDWSIAVKKGDLLTINCLAQRLGSTLDPVVAIVDAADKEVLKLDGDKSAEWSPPADGVYRVQIRDRFRSRGGPAFAYRVKIAPMRSDFRVTLGGDAVTGLRKNQGKVKINVQRFGGFKDPIAVAAEDLPEGVSALPLTIAPGQANAELTLKIDDNAPIAAKAIRVVAAAAPVKAKDVKKKDAKEPAKEVKDEPLVFDHRAVLSAGPGEATIDTVLCAVALPTPFVIKGEYDMGFAARGGMRKRVFKIERNGFDGPIEIRLAERQARHLQGVVGPTMVVPPGQSDFTYECYLPPWMELGRTCRVCVMGVGVVKDGGRDHKVAFSSTNQNEQLVAVVGAGHLALDLGRVAAVAKPGQTVEVPFTVKRGLGWKGPVSVTLETAKHIKDVQATPVTVAADQDRGVLTVRFGSAPGPFNMPLTVRAVLTQGTQRIVAEESFDVTVE